MKKERPKDVNMYNPVGLGNTSISTNHVLIANLPGHCCLLSEVCIMFKVPHQQAVESS